jgi:hypothetical protein
MLGHRKRLAVIALFSGCFAICGAGPDRKPGIPSRGAVGVYIYAPRVLVAGSTASCRVAVHWATRPGKTGPLPGAAVRLSLRDEGRVTPLTTGRTDSTGSAHFRFVVPAVDTKDSELVVAVRSRLGSDTRKKEVSVYPGGRVLLTTDKALYQPGQTIHVRALALRSMDLRPVAGRPIRLQVKDPKDNVVHAKTARTSRFGIASLDLELADEINLGAYTVAAWVDGAGSEARALRTVTVKRYVLPKLKVSVETERAYYRPGETVQGTVRARYFFGKPVSGGHVYLDIRSRGGGGSVTRHRLPCGGVTAKRLRCKLDRDGRYRFDLHPGGAGDRVPAGELRVRALVEDNAGQRQWGDLSVPFTSQPLRFSVVPENGRLVAGVTNRVHVVAGYVDGKPAQKAFVMLRLGKRHRLERTDELGVASFKIRLPCSKNPDQETRVPLTIRVKDRLGEQAATRTSLAVHPRGGVLLRPERSIVQAGEPVVVRAVSSTSARFATGRRVFLDVVKAGQTLATYTRRLARGRTTFRFSPAPTLFGLLELRAYRLDRDGERRASSRMIYVNHPGELRIKAKADRATYRPGQRARVRFEVTDSRTGEGVQAALGVHAIDEAVVALGGLQRTGSPKLFFTLASQAENEDSDVEVAPDGKRLAHWVGPGANASRAARAADVLLAALRPLAVDTWETNPWRERREAWELQGPQLVDAAKKFMETHSVGQRTSDGWRFHPNLVPRMARAKAVEARQALDPWNRVVRPWMLAKVDPGFAFAPLAASLAREKLGRIYDKLFDAEDKLSLKGEPVPGIPEDWWPTILPRSTVQTLVKKHKLARTDTIDPWGKPYRVGKWPTRLVEAYDRGIISRYVIRSAGPDGRFGTRDDVTPPGPRFKVKVHGPNKRLGADAAKLLKRYHLGTLGTIGRGGGGGSGAGYGRGAGSLRGRRARAPRVVAGAAMPARVRSSFPETLVWRPELVTDRQGRATLDVDLADSITDWRMLATGSTESGLLGSTSLTLRVFQEFFVDLDLPPTLTQGDRIGVPVTVHNYLKTRQRIRLRLAPEPWFKTVGPREQQIELGPSQVGVRVFPVVVRRVGRGDLTVHARTDGGSADSVRRSTLVEPDGVEHAASFGGTLRAAVSHRLVRPAGAIPGTGKLVLKILPGAVSQTLAGMQAMLRRPHGCFEQTSSATYPNVLVLDYLRRTKQLTPAVERRARRFVSMGYQRLISFEVPGGGFSWFGGAPANKVLTAYGLMEFFDMSRVHPVDPKLIRRTQVWLARHQKSDGSFRPDRRNVLDGAVNNFTSDTLRVTAYIARALQRTGHRGEVIERAKTYVRRNARRVRDAYTLALIADLLVADKKNARDVLKRLWAKRSQTPKGIFFKGPSSTLTHGAGSSSDIETTARAALALLRAPSPPPDLNRVLDALHASKDQFGIWHSTQATILALRALLLQQERVRSRPEGEVQVLVNGRERARLKLEARASTLQRLDLSHYARNDSKVDLRFAGKGNVQYHLVSRSWIRRRGRAPARPRGTLGIVTRFSRSKMTPGKKVQLDVVVVNHDRKRVNMPLVSVALPPGFEVAEEDLLQLVGRRRVEKVQRVGNRALLYLSSLGRGERQRYRIHLTSKHPLRVQARPSVIYEYYRPENRAESAPRTLLVQLERATLQRPPCRLVRPKRRYVMDCR